MRRLKELLRSALGLNSQPEIVQEPIIPGSVWRFRGNANDPFPPPEHAAQSRAVVLEVKEGWIRYSLGDFFPDNRMREEMFRHCYERIME